MTVSRGHGKLHRVRDVWRNRDFLHFIVGRSLGVASRQMLSVAVAWDVYARTRDVVDLGLIGLVMFLPILLFAIPAGVLADRIDRRAILGGALVLQCIATGAIGLWFHLGGPGVAPVFMLLFVSGCAHAFLNPAMSSTLPKLVPREVFSNAVATSSSFGKIATLAGPVGAGLLLAMGGQAVYGVIALMFLLAAVSAVMIRADLRISEREPIGIAVLFGGFRYIWVTPTVLAAMSIDLVAVLFGGITGILPAYAVDILGVGAEGLGFMRAAPAMGALVIGVALAGYRLPWSVGRSFFVSLTIFGVAILLFSVSRNYWLSLAALAIYGAADMVSVYVRHTLIQIDTPDDLRGRVSAVGSIAGGGFTQLGDFRAGLMAGAIGTTASVAVGGLVTLAAVALWHRKFPELRKLDTF